MPPEQVIGRNVFVEAEIIEQPRRVFPEIPSSPSLPQNQRDLMNHGTPPLAIKQPLFQRYLRSPDGWSRRQATFAISADLDFHDFSYRITA